MPGESVRIVRDVLDAMARGDWETAIAAFDPEVELDMSRMPGGGVYRGAEEVWRFYARWLGSWEDLRIAPQGVLEVGDNRVLALTEIRGRGRGSGVPVHMSPADLMTVQAGRVVRSVGYPDRREAVEELGLVLEEPR